MSFSAEKRLPEPLEMGCEPGSVPLLLVGSAGGRTGFFRPYGACTLPAPSTHGLRRAPHSFAASRLGNPGITQSEVTSCPTSVEYLGTFGNNCGSGRDFLPLVNHLGSWRLWFGDSWNRD